MEREIIYLSLHCLHQYDSCIKMGRDESHFNVSVGSDGQRYRIVSTNHNFSGEKGAEAANVLPLGQTGSQERCTVAWLNKQGTPFKSHS